MNPTTADVLKFLSFPDLDFGTNPLDLEMVQDPALIRELTTRLLAGPFELEESRDAAEALQGRLDAADWGAVAEAMRERFRLTDDLFDTGGQNKSYLVCLAESVSCYGGTSAGATSPQPSCYGVDWPGAFQAE